MRVTSARVILANYDLLKRDFAELKKKSRTEIDEWILKHAAFVSRPQAAQTIVNTPIQTSSGDEVLAYRPLEYGRSLVFHAGKEGLLDVKGVGSVNPGMRDHGNGLASLGETIREYLYESLVHEIFERSGSPFETVRSYAVLDFGFDVINAKSESTPAGAIVRQAHERKISRESRLTPEECLNIEKLLRYHGISSAGAYRNDYPYEWLNIQGTRDGRAVIDFGGFIAVEKFTKPLLEFNTHTLARHLMNEAEVGALQPDPKSRVPYELWGATISGISDPAYDNPWIWSKDLAENLRSGKASRADAEQHVRNLLDPVVKRLTENPVSWREFSRRECQKKLTRPKGRWW